ncbi:hypothetical protein BWZ22_07850 [Seonamhaeicola sp. S2-3]|uniref:DUF4270 domain-containing protein n=1 Tax=Seonamhaeicola sp. S2-3 TaxID=1936081 RepID=UPI000972DADE|nr:DUF4270 domain-containing protein [Seonamhaeicola sp. S2-3]APY11161.1 hypothetical protein BWZ22_07850 [Seonamhaeicola sp. S2-3]
MKKTIKALQIPVILLLLVISFIACDKDFNIIDSDVLGRNHANFNTDVDTLPIVSYNKILDSVQINGLPSNLLGYYNDPEYGPTTASVITQIIPNSYDPDFGENPVIDSVVLSVPYYSEITGIDDDGNTTYSINDSLYGNPISNMKLSIYENGYFLRDFNPDNLEEGQNYYSHANSGDPSSNYALTDNTLINFDAFKGALIKDTIFTPSSNPIVTVVRTDSDTTETISVPALRIKLDNNFWNSAIISKEGQTELSNASNFKNYFRGLYFKAEAISGNGSMVLLNFGSSDASVTIYYSSDDEDNAGEQIQSTYSFNFSGNRLNTFINEHTVVIPTPNKTLGDDKIYLKGGQGSMAIVDLFPTTEALNDFLNEFRIPDGDDYLKDESTGEYVLKKLINEAHLLIYEDETSTTSLDDYHKYDRIYAYDIENNSETIDYLFDVTENTSEPVNSRIISLGVRDTINKNFKIRLTEHLNNILVNDSTNTKIGLVLSTNVNLTTNSEILKSEDVVTAIPMATVLAPKGTILHGSNSANQEKRMILKLFYTEPK